MFLDDAFQHAMGIKGVCISQFTGRNGITHVLSPPFNWSTFELPFKKIKVGLRGNRSDEIEYQSRIRHEHSRNRIKSCNLSCSINVAFEKIHARVFLGKCLKCWCNGMARPTPSLVSRIGSDPINGAAVPCSMEVDNLRDSQH